MDPLIKSSNQSEPLENNIVNTDYFSYKLRFTGNGSEYFAILIVNWFLTIITFGIYYPWARAKSLRYIYGSTTLNNERFHFSGTGLEMFKGLLKVIFLYLLFLLLFILIETISPVLSIIVIYLVGIAILPFIIHGSLKYSMSRTSYRGIRFGYRGSRSELAYKFFGWFVLTILTLGIYSFWLSMNLRRYTHSHFRYGELKFSNNCNGGDWFWINFKGYLLTLFTFGIYFFWWQRDIFNYYWNNLKVNAEDKQISFNSIASGGRFFNLLMGNLLIIVFSLGLGSPWAYVRTNRFICDNLYLSGNINLELISQTEEDYNDATGEGAMDYFDVDIG